MSKSPNTLRPFGAKDRVGYMLGNVANDFTFIFASLYLQVFYTDVLGINAALVGTMFLVSRILDAFTDTAMGRICDKTKATKNGKFKPWLLRACGPVALASFLMYQTFATNLPMTLRIVYMFVTYLLWGSICYTCINEEVFGKAVNMINGFKNYFLRHNEVVYENPSPGNKKGGITTLEEKSLGCVEKAGTSEIVDVLGYGELVKEVGVSALNAPGNDLIAATALAASGCQLVLFTTGRGTPFSTFVPTLKIASNTPLSDKKKGWIDFDAYTMDEDGLFELVVATANGTYTAKSEDVREIAFYKTGVTL